MDAENIRWCILALVVLDFLVEFILDFLNLRHQKTQLPSELSSVYDAEKFAKAQSYFIETTKFGFITSTFSFILLISVLLIDALGWLDIFIKISVDQKIVQSLLFFAVLFVVSDIIQLPFALYRTFVLEEKYGFNKSTLKLFFIDKLKGYLLAIVIGGALLSILLWLIDVLKQDFWWCFWLVFAVFILFINLFYTSLLLPLFNKLVPLEAGSLRSSIETYSRKVDFPLANIMVMDGSKRSTKSNAFFSGIGKQKKIVLFDTLIKNHTEEELVAVLAHEAGHYKKKHIQQGMVISLIQSALMLYILSLFVSNKELSFALGGGEYSIHLNLIAFALLYSPLSHIIGIVMNIWSRKNEYEADRYAADTYSGEALASALKKLSADNLSNLTPHPAVVFVHYSHPPLLQRLKALVQQT